MSLPDFIRTTIFRWTSLAFVACILAFAAFVYWETASYLLAKIDAAVAEEALSISHDTSQRQIYAIEDRVREDPRRIKLAGLFAADGQRIAGNMEDMPPGLGADGMVHGIRARRIDVGSPAEVEARAIAIALGDGRTLVIARTTAELGELGEAVARALLLGIPCVIALSFVVGAVISLRMQKRVTELDSLVRQIVDGDLRQRIPLQNLQYPFDKLARIANRMLDELQGLVREMAGVGNEIAHDLRTPLTRARLSLDRGRANAQTLTELQENTDRAIGQIDEAMRIITSLLHIADIENSRSSALEAVELSDVVREVGELYQPIAEDRNVTLRVCADEQNLVVRGDRELLVEAVANLVDNAVKFTPSGGAVDLCALRDGDNAVVRVKDTGPGIGEDEVKSVTRRFYRADKSRNTVGVGLGLSIVSAIAKKHGFHFSVAAGAGCVTEIAGRIVT